MRSWVRLGMLAGLLLAMAAAESFVHARPARGRQYYSHWSYYRDRSYYYRTYNYAVSDDDDNYQYDYVIYYPTRPRQYYYYNPRSKRYWGRYDVEAKGYSLLAEKDRKGELKDIPEDAFPKPAAMPNIPGAKDGVKMEAPPLDVPKDTDAKELP
jgi:hypothetical protein